MSHPLYAFCSVHAFMTTLPIMFTMFIRIGTPFSTGVFIDSSQVVVTRT